MYVFMKMSFKRHLNGKILLPEKSFYLEEPFFPLLGGEDAAFDFHECMHNRESHSRCHIGTKHVVWSGNDCDAPCMSAQKRACKNECRPAQSARQQASVRVYKNHWSHIIFTGQLYEADSSDIIIIVTKKVIYQYMHMYSNIVMYQ